MYLKKIEIFGFKSFAEKTEILFERGVTCIVGPNGCGKSNISDSIRWVLGERSAKLLRGSKMEDVIFSGTEFRKPLNLAEVSLTIDNTDQKLPIQYEEVVLTRRLHRSGESEYLLNRTPCRLKDIQDLILDTGIGSNSYSMIEQGRIDYILNAEAEERRFLIEEAAGISKYKVKKEEALRKLERTEQNLLRLNDITSEVERNIRYAERQAKRAERYKEQFERLKLLEIKKAFFEIGLLNQQLSSLHRERDEQQTLLNELEEKSANQNISARNIDERLQNLEALFFEQENARSEAKQELISIDSQIQFHNEKIEFLKLAAEKALGEIESLTKRCVYLTSELTANEARNAELNLVLSELHLEKNQLESKLSELSQEAISEKELTDQQSALFDFARQLSDFRNSIHKAQGELIACERTSTNLTESLQKLSQNRQSYLLRQETASEERSGYEKKRSEIEFELFEALKKREDLESSLEHLHSQLSKAHVHKTETESKIHLLEELNRASGVDPKQIAAHHDLSLKGVTKTFLDLIQVEPGFELAAEAALSETLSAVVTDTVETAAHLLERLQESGYQQANIFIKDQISVNGSLKQNEAANTNGWIKKRLWDVIQIKDGYTGIFAKLLGNVYVIDQLSSQNIVQLAPLAENLKLVTRNGAIFGPNFQISLRYCGLTPERSSFVRKQELIKLASICDNAKKGETDLSDSIQRADSELKDVKERGRLLNRQLLEFQSSVMQHEGALTSVNEYVAKIDEEIKLTTKEREINEAETFRRKEQLQELSRRYSEIELEETKVKQYMELNTRRIEAYQTAKNEVTNACSQVYSKIGLTSEKQSSTQKTIELLTNQLAEHKDHISVLNIDRQKSFNQIDQLQKELVEFSRRKETAERKVFEHSVQVEQLKRERSEILILRNQAVQEAQNTNKALDELKQKFHHFSLQEMELNHHDDSIQQDLQSRYKITLTTLNPADYPSTAEDLETEKQEIETLREKLDAIGTVNLLAIDEYQELKERYDFLLNQKRDLSESQESLLETIRKINRTTKKLFEETLVRVRESFREYYRTLFGGGFADLILIDEQNPFESGLDIIARPPGKKTQHITLLSGGEKALTAIALLLALFSVKPSPFCVLDEVDAPLDEANNDRFINVLKPFLETTQFIIVTHSRKTIAVGDALYGVTMQEAGISKLVSVKLSQDTDSIEHSDAKVATELNQILN